MSVDVSLTLVLRNQLLAFLIVAFQSLDNGIVRKECAPLVSISVWNHLEGEKAREAKFEEHTQLRKAWRAAIRRYEAADELQKARIDFERSWLYSMISGFLNILYSSEDFSTGKVLEEYVRI